MATHKQARNISNQIVWQWGHKSNLGMFSHIGSGAQRLPNGNPLICAMTEGHIIEVSPEGDAVWEYISPITRADVFTELRNNIPLDNASFRAYRYSADYEGLVGKDLRTDKGTITESTSFTGFDFGSDSSGSGASGGAGEAIGGAGAAY